MATSCKDTAPKILSAFLVLALCTSHVMAGLFGFHNKFDNAQPDDSLDELHRVNARDPIRPIVTVYKTKITTHTRVFMIHQAPCAKLVNVTGQCKIRRGRWVEDPVVLTFDDETERMVDALYTPVLSLEATRKPEDLHLDDFSQKEQLVPDKPTISPSFEEHSNEKSSYGDRSSRFYFSQVVDALQPLRSRAPHITKTVTFYSTVFTSTKRTSRNTFFVQGCTPHYFPFHICSKQE